MVVYLSVVLLSRSDLEIIQGRFGNLYVAAFLRTALSMPEIERLRICESEKGYTYHTVTYVLNEYIKHANFSNYIITTLYSRPSIADINPQR